jgi:hypothetical protein
MADEDEVPGAGARARAEIAREDREANEAAQVTQAQEAIDLVGDLATPTEPDDDSGEEGMNEINRAIMAAEVGNRQDSEAEVARARALLAPPTIGAAPLTGAPTLDPVSQRRESEGRGCLPAGLMIPAAIATILAVLIGGLILFNNSSTDDAPRTARPPSTAAVTAPESSCSEQGARGDGVVLIACDQPASIAGHWELASGLRNPKGLDEGTITGPDFSGALTLGERSASFDIADDGAVTGGSYNTEHTESGGDDGCTRVIALSASSATGSFQPDGFGTVTWNGSQTLTNSCREGTGETAFPLTMYFFQAGDGLVACRLGPGATIPTTTPTACEGDQAAQFQRS